MLSNCGLPDYLGEVMFPISLRLALISVCCLQCVCLGTVCFVVCCHTPSPENLRITYSALGPCVVDPICKYRFVLMFPYRHIGSNTNGL